MIGILGGTFNPIHFGHINIALELQEKRGLEAVWFMPAHLSPFRSDIAVSKEHRKHMAELAIRDIPNFFLNDMELNRPPPSYTVDTFRELVKSGKEFALLMGEDTALNFDQWKEPLEIVRIATVLVGCRSSSSLAETLKKKKLHPEIKTALTDGMVETCLMDISGTRIRQRIRGKSYCGHLIPSRTLDYIYENHLYFNG